MNTPAPSSFVEPSPSAYQEFAKGLWRENTIFVSVIGMCPSMAVTNSVINGLAMGAVTFAVLVGSSFLVSLLRRFIPSQVRIIAYIIIISTFVTVADYTLQAHAPTVHKDLGAFLALVVVNCVILGRAEAFASRNRPWAAVADAAGMSGGFAIALFMLSTVREVLGNGSWMGIRLFGDAFEPWVIMILPPGGFLTLGLMLAVFAAVKKARRTPLEARA